jgi:hypothetical protein
MVQIGTSEALNTVEITLETKPASHGPAVLSVMGTNTDLAINPELR